MFTVTGVLDGRPYDVTVGADTDPRWGIVAGSLPARTLLESLAGQGVEAGPAGPFYKLVDDDPAAILAALTQHTQVLATTGDVPDLFAGR